MPIYEYRCENGHSFEVLQSMSDDPVANCTECGAPVERVLNPVAVHFKGSGFYTTDYARKGAKGDAKKDGAKADKSEGGGGASGGDSKKSESGSKGSEKAGKGSGSTD